MNDHGDPGPAAADAALIEVHAEKLNVTTREVVTGRVRVVTETQNIDHVVRQELAGSRAEVVRVPIDRTLAADEAPPQVRTEGSITIVPVFEEILVIEKRLLLREELHITQHETTENVEIPVTLRRQQAIVDRPFDQDDDPQPTE